MIASTPSMTEFGSYHFIFQPPSDDGGECPAVEFSVSAEATLTQMVQHFQQFLSSSGYELGDRNLQLVDNGYHSQPTRDVITGFVPSSEWGNTTTIYGGQGTDTISFAGAAMSPDTISFSDSFWG